MENLYVTSEITLNKTVEKRSSPVPTNTEFFSFDQRVAKKTINFQFKGEPLDLSEANVILGFDFVTAGQSVIFESADGSIIIEDSAAGKVNVMLPNDIYAYSGSVIIYVFVEFSNGQSLDYPAFSTEFQESWIDQDLEEMAQFYVRRFEDLRNLVLEQAAGIDRDLTEFENRIDQIESDLAAFDIEALAKEIEEEIRSAVEDRISDIEQKLEGIDLLTVDEVDQRIAEIFLDPFTLTLPQKLTFNGKIRGSVIENANRFTTTSSANQGNIYQGNSQFQGTEVAQEIYDFVGDQNAQTAIPEINGTNFSTRAIFLYFDLIDHIDREYPVIFLAAGATTSADKEAVVRKYVKNLTLYADMRLTTQQLTGVNLRIRTRKEYREWHVIDNILFLPRDTLKEITVPIEIQTGGHGICSFATDSSWGPIFEIDYITCTFDLVIDYQLLAKGMSNFQEVLHLAQRVNELESKG